MEAKTETEKGKAGNNDAQYLATKVAENLRDLFRDKFFIVNEDMLAEVYLKFRLAFLSGWNGATAKFLADLTEREKEISK